MSVCHVPSHTFTTLFFGGNFSLFIEIVSSNFFLFTLLLFPFSFFSFSLLLFTLFLLLLFYFFLFPFLLVPFPFFLFPFSFPSAKASKEGPVQLLIALFGSQPSCTQEDTNQIEPSRTIYCHFFGCCRIRWTHEIFLSHDACRVSSQEHTVSCRR